MAQWNFQIIHQIQSTDPIAEKSIRKNMGPLFKDLHKNYNLLVNGESQLAVSFCVKDKDLDSKSRVLTY